MPRHDPCRLARAAIGALLFGAAIVPPAAAFRQIPLTPAREALSAAVEAHYRAAELPKGLIYLPRRRGLPPVMRASIRSGETYRVVFVNGTGPPAARQRFAYRLFIDGRRVRLQPAWVRGDERAFHVAALRVGRHGVRIAVVDLATRRRRMAYSGQVLVTGGGPVRLVVGNCGALDRCRVTLRNSGRTLFGRP